MWPSKGPQSGPERRPNGIVRTRSSRSWAAETEGTGKWDFTWITAREARPGARNAPRLRGPGQLKMGKVTYFGGTDLYQFD